jgi:hypothetical protein
MSYDLYLRQDGAFSAKDFLAFFADRPNYQASEKQVAYANETTGVYFFFDLAGEDADPPHHVAFNLNFYRPHFFGLEAAAELSAVVERFSFQIHDPQNAGMGDGPFSVEGFLTGWNHGNEFAYQAILTGENVSDSISVRPTAELEAIWRWNFWRDRLQAEQTDDVFVPRIFWGVLDGQFHSMVAWPDAIPSLLPQVDMFIIGRDELAPRRFLLRSKDTCYVPASVFDELLPLTKREQWSLPCRVAGYDAPPAPLKDLIRGFKSDSRQLSGLGLDSVLNQELVERWRKR